MTYRSRAEILTSLVACILVLIFLLPLSVVWYLIWGIKEGLVEWYEGWIQPMPRSFKRLLSKEIEP